MTTEKRIALVVAAGHLQNTAAVLTAVANLAEKGVDVVVCDEDEAERRLNEMTGAEADATPVIPVALNLGPARIVLRYEEYGEPVVAHVTRPDPRRFRDRTHPPSPRAGRHRW